MKVAAPNFGDIGITQLACDMCGGPIFINWKSRDGRDCCSRKCQKKAEETMSEEIETTNDNPITAGSAPVKPGKKAKGGAQVPKAASGKGKAAKVATTPATDAPKGKKTTKVAASGPREGSKSAQVVTLLRRKSGATLDEIMGKMGWQKHTTAAFLSAGGSLTKKFGIVVNSTKSDKGVRTYRIA